jgi:site-specific recombinase XerC
LQVKRSQGITDGGSRKRSQCSSFLLVKNNRASTLKKHLETLVHSCATAVTKALSNEADIAKVQEWLGQPNVSTTRLCDRRKSKPEDTPTFHVKY